MSPQGAWFLMWHPDRPEEPQVLQALNFAMAMQICDLPDDGRREHYKSLERPDMLTQVAVMEGDIGLAEVAIEHWPESDKSKKNRGRALECFKEAFGRSYRKNEAMALSNIVERAGLIDGIVTTIITEDEEEITVTLDEHPTIPPGEELAAYVPQDVADALVNKTTEETDEHEDKTIQGGDAPEDTGGEGDNGIRLGRPSWTDKERAVTETEREPPMAALGDPRDPDAAEKRARLRG